MWNKKQEKMRKQDYLNCIFDILSENGMSEDERKAFVDIGMSGDSQYSFEEYFWGETYSFVDNELSTDNEDNEITCSEINEQLKKFASKYSIKVANPTIETVELLMDEPNFEKELLVFINDFVDRLQNAGEAASDN